MRNILTLTALVILCSCSAAPAETVEKNEVKSQQAVEVETPNINNEIDKPEVLENDNYAQDWENIKAAFLSKDESEIGIHCAMAGVDKPKLIEAIEQAYVLESFKNSSFDDLVPDQKGKKAYLKYYIENPSNPKENLSIFLNQGPHLFIEYFINMK